MAFPGDGQAMDKNLLVKTIQTMNQHLPNKRDSICDRTIDHGKARH